jgi:hypothetical protein
VAVIVPPSRLPATLDAVRTTLPAVQAGAGADSRRAPVVLLPAEAKGLEFDSVVLVDPCAVLAEGVRGYSDLYVALTRSTQRLAVVHPGELPEELSALVPA